MLIGASATDLETAWIADKPNPALQFTASRGSHVEQRTAKTVQLY